MADANVLTMDVMKEMLRRLDEAEAEADLDLFMSDDWDFYKIVKAGGTIVEYNGMYYAVAPPEDLLRRPQFLPYAGPKSPFR